MILQGLQVFPDRMRANLGLTHGVLLSERYMMALAPHPGRLQAHDLVHEACREALERNCNLADVLYQMPEIRRQFDSAQLQAALADPREYLGTARLMVDAILDAADQFKQRGC